MVTVAMLFVIGACLWYRLQRWNEIAYPRMVKHSNGMIDDIMQWRADHGKPMLPPSWNTNPPAPYGTNRVAHHSSIQVLQNLGFRQRADELSEAEKIEMTNLFATKLKPAVEKWASVYGDRVPFSLADLTMDKFVERFGRDSKTYHSYTFVMGDITLAVVQQNGDTAVGYLASKRGLAAMQTVNGAEPDMSTPVTPQQALALAEADSGQQFAPNLVRVIPSAESGSLAGGAIVDVGSEIKNAMGIPISKGSAGFNYVFAQDGTLAYYKRAK